MKCNKIKLAVILSIGISLVGCSEQETPQQYAVRYAKDHPDEYIQQQAAQQYAPQAQQAPVAAPQVVYEQAPPQYVQSAPAQATGGHDGTDMLMAGAVGYALGGMGGGNRSGGYSSNGYNSNHTVVNKTTVINNHPAPAAPAPRVNTYRPATSYSRPSSFSSSRSSSFGSSRSFSRRR